MIIYPNEIKKGDTIGITATSSGSSEEADLKKLDNAYKNITNLGYKYIETDNVRKNSKLVSSEPEIRAKEFMNLWMNDNISWIAAVSGGEFLMEILPYLDSETIRSNSPKWVQGFSDTSLLLYYLTTKFNIATVHATNFRTYGMRELDKTLLKTIEILEEGKRSEQVSLELYEAQRRGKGEELEPFNLTEKVEYKHLYKKKEDEIEGRLIGGCIDVLKNLIGTRFDNTINFCQQFKKEGMLWYLENCEMSVAELYRSLWQMKECGWFNNANGFLIGRTFSKENVEDFTYQDALHKIFDDLNIPVIYDVDIGHVAPQWTMINGAYGRFKFNVEKTCKIIQEMV